MLCQNEVFLRNDKKARGFKVKQENLLDHETFVNLCLKCSAYRLTCGINDELQLELTLPEHRGGISSIYLTF